MPVFIETHFTSQAERVNQYSALIQNEPPTHNNIADQGVKVPLRMRIDQTLRGAVIDFSFLQNAKRVCRD